ncbi:MAG TPA: hypothetical protein ENJ57_08100 [Rhizobiales bacterium]|nr:hypothetical protein [Hyphomicrobiales bacterium]
MEFQLLKTPILTSVTFILTLITSISTPLPSAQAQQAGKVLRLESKGLKLEMQRLSRQRVQAFFIGRGFSAAHALMIARQGCIFRSAIGNSGKMPEEPQIKIDLRQWQVMSKGKNKKMRVREQWQKIWEKENVSEEARTAFYWALFPTRQTYAPTDYNWGMLSFGLAPGARFDLVLRWTYGEKQQMTVLKGLQCAQ